MSTHLVPLQFQFECSIPEIALSALLEYGSQQYQRNNPDEKARPQPREYHDPTVPEIETVRN